MAKEKTYTINITENERAFLILALRHLQECNSIRQGRGIRPIAFMISNKLFGRGYKEGDWEKHIKKIINNEICKFEPSWKYLKKVGDKNKPSKIHTKVIQRKDTYKR